ncbi:MAG: helix-turn-helix domain-containing protein [Bradyrhizobium sp.]|uniref:MarR family transcriptional regulator n=1 Tax=Bradyrhizobium sp. TaxID=376 RepID=UPI00272FD8EE|nr:helix-turn-helix domain-containing protein [Bradyrhizobium sp.]MDP1866988.1 helix-turn-helix domain-containing protein [Bradyrhizobium sp.]
MGGQPVDGEAEVDGQGIWVSISELARIKGKSKQAVSKRVKRLVESKALETRPGDGGEILVNRVAYDRAIGAHTDPAQALRNPGSDLGNAADAPPSAAPSAGDDAPPAKSKGYLLHKETSAAYQAENDRLDLEERLGHTCDSRDVEHRTFGAFRKLRDRMLSVSGVLASRLVNAVDEHAGRMILDEEFRKMLAALANDLDKAGDDIDPDDAEEEPEIGEEVEGAAALQ